MNRLSIFLVLFLSIGFTDIRINANEFLLQVLPPTKQEAKQIIYELKSLSTQNVQLELNLKNNSNSDQDIDLGNAVINGQRPHVQGAVRKTLKPGEDHSAVLGYERYSWPNGDMVLEFKDIRFLLTYQAVTANMAHYDINKAMVLLYQNGQVYLEKAGTPNILLINSNRGLTKARILAGEELSELSRQDYKYWTGVLPPTLNEALVLLKPADGNYSVFELSKVGKQTDLVTLTVSDNLQVSLPKVIKKGTNLNLRVLAQQPLERVTVSFQNKYYALREVKGFWVGEVPISEDTTGRNEIQIYARGAKGVMLKVESFDII